MKFKILVTPQEAGKILKKHQTNEIEFVFTNGKVEEPEKLKGLLSQVDGAILDVEKVNSDTISRAAKLKIISRFGVGYDSIDTGALKEKGVNLSITYGVVSEAVARHALSFLLSFTRHLSQNKVMAQNGLWERTSNLDEEGSTVGIVGYGTIGKKLAEYCLNLGFKVAVYARTEVIDPAITVYKTIDEVIKGSDFVSVHLPLSDETRNLFSGNILELLKGKFLINTSRGCIVNEKEVINMLDHGELNGYATDVFETEPYSGISLELARHPKTLISQHIACNDYSTAKKMAFRALDNVVNCLKNQKGKINKLIV